MKVLFWPDGRVTDRFSVITVGTLPKGRIQEFVRNVFPTHTWGELPALIKNFKSWRGGAQENPRSMRTCNCMPPTHVHRVYAMENPVERLEWGPDESGNLEAILSSGDSYVIQPLRDAPEGYARVSLGYALLYRSRNKVERFGTFPSLQKAKTFAEVVHSQRGRPAPARPNPAFQRHFSQQNPIERLKWVRESEESYRDRTDTYSIHSYDTSFRIWIIYYRSNEIGRAVSLRDAKNEAQAHAQSAFENPIANQGLVIGLGIAAAAGVAYAIYTATKATPAPASTIAVSVPNGGVGPAVATVSVPTSAAFVTLIPNQPTQLAPLMGATFVTVSLPAGATWGPNPTSFPGLIPGVSTPITLAAGGPYILYWNAADGTTQTTSLTVS
jgi:hypothetical protein